MELAQEILEEFAAYGAGFSIEDIALSNPWHRNVYDPHPDADKYIAGTPEERAAIADRCSRRVLDNTVFHPQRCRRRRRVVDMTPAQRERRRWYERTRKCRLRSAMSPERRAQVNERARLRYEQLGPKRAR